MEVNLDNLVSNLNYYRSRIRPTTKLMAMVKAASYGAGTTEIANSDKGPVPSLSATASRKGDIINVDITNIDLKNDQEVLLTWDDLGKVRKRDVSARILTAKKITDCNEFGKKAKVAPEAFKDYKVTSDGIEIKVPAMSIIAIEIK